MKRLAVLQDPLMMYNEGFKYVIVQSLIAGDEDVFMIQITITVECAHLPNYINYIVPAKELPMFTFNDP